MLKRVILTGIAIMCATSVFGKHDGGYLNDLTMKFKTPHLQWAPKLKDGKIKTLFILARKGGRDAVEVTQRMELDLNAVNAVNAVNLAIENMYESSVDGTTKYEKKQELLKKLDKKYDIFVIGNFWFEKLPAEAKFKILSQVMKGAGLVFVYPRKTELKKLYSKPIKGEAAILALVGKAGLPSKISKLSDSELLKTYQLGKGRIAILDYKANHGAHYGGQSLTVPNAYSKQWEAEFENNLVLVMRTMKWAAGRESSVEITCPALVNSPELSQKAQTIDLELKSESKFNGKLEVRLRNEFNSIIKTEKLPCDFTGGSKQPFAIPFLPSGKYYLDVLVEQNGLRDNFGYFAFTINSSIKPILSATEAISHHGPIKAELKLNKQIKGSVEVTLSDSPYNRVWFKQTYDLDGDQLDLDISNYYIPTIAGYLKCAVKQNGKTLANVEKTVFFPNSKLENYLEMGWNSVPDVYLGRIQSERIVDTLGWRAGLNHPSKGGTNARKAALLNQRFVPYMTRIGLNKGKNGEVTQYSWFCLPKKDIPAQKALNGDESFYSPEVKRLWRESIKHRVENLPKYGPALYNLGDENHFSYDAGFGKTDAKGFSEFLKNKYGSIAKLNRERGTKYSSFDLVPHHTLKEAKEKKIYPAWYDHRQYMEKMYADLHHFLASEIKKYDPTAKVGAEGSVPGDLETTINGLDFWGPYTNLVMDEVLRSIGGDRVRMLWWGGYVGSHGGRGKYPLPLWKDLLTGNVNGSAWFSASNASGEGILGTDLDFADYAKKLIPHMLEMQNGLAQLLNSTPLENNGIAILWSHPSDSARLLDPKFVNPRDSIGTFIRFCYKNALNFDFMTESIIDRLKNYKVLFLFGNSSLSEKESAAILAFVKNGGTVIADMNPGILNENMRLIDSNPLRELFGNITYGKTKAATLAPINLNLKYKKTVLSLRAEKGNMIQGSKLVAVRNYGKGDAILLNFTLSSADTTSSKDASLEAFLLKLLAEINVKPDAYIKGITHKDAIIRVRKGDGFTVVGLLATKNDVGKSAIIALPKKSYIYATGKGFLTHAKSVTIKLDKPLKLITCFAKRPSAPTIDLSSETTTPGKAISLNLSGFISGRVLFLQIRDTAEKLMTLRKKVIIVEGKTDKYPIHFAYNDASGTYTLILTDVASGLKSKKRINLK